MILHVHSNIIASLALIHYCKPGSISYNKLYVQCNANGIGHAPTYLYVYASTDANQYMSVSFSVAL